MNKKNLFSIKLILLNILILVNCTTMPNTSDIRPVRSKNLTISEIVILNPISAPALEGTSEQNRIEERLTVNLKNFLEMNEIFEQVNLNFEVEDSDKSNRLQFTFTEYKIIRKPNPWSLPLGILTLGIYMFISPLAHDHVHFICEMEVLAANKKVVFKTIREIKQEREINVFSSESKFPNGGEARALLFLDLINEYKNSKVKK